MNRSSSPSSPSSEPSPSGSALERQLNPQHPLIKLAASIDWASFETSFSRATTSAGGRPPLPTRLMVGLHYLKGLYDESDESVVSKWVENPYWQHFCGEEQFQHQLPCHPTSLVTWRKYVGVDGMEHLLKQVLKTAMEIKILKPREISRVNVDTTVQEKAIAFPTDSRLYDKARRALVRAARKQNIKLRQSYERVGKKTLFQQSRYRVAKQLKRAQKQTQKLRTYLGRVIRDIERKLPQPDPDMQSLLERAKRIYQQQRTDSNKLYSLHAPEVECIAKGKAHQRYEFGCKVVLVTTSQSNWIVGTQAIHGNPYDGATLTPVLEQTQALTGVKPKQAAVDKGFRGQSHHPQGVEVLVAGTRKFKGVLKRLVKRRSAIEPVIGHIKYDHGLKRNYLKGTHGDRINALMVACGFNLRKLCRYFLDSPATISVRT
ncbi:IS5 family transposase [Leptothoe spongobia]|uniref:IS5 family transposase n=1 Tax=Leptothoe spongobia TAU-MAC 1115 TaxID=1967444 RepID=A0A947GLA0_9CYAN|nr:IS5 family transposase [Leptothoe spongobia]MBT9314906.1 IS5 family transposase [Leptothoe spongobia TAU-MAC 1115]